jgi:2,5-furandicarboxylate decarboxylase 1
MATRFQADRDFVINSNFRTMPLDPSLHGGRTGSKAGFDLTFPFGWQKSQEYRVPAPPDFGEGVRASVKETLQSGPKYFRELMQAMGTRDGRDTTLQLDELRQQHLLQRDSEGRYQLKN